MFLLTRRLWGPIDFVPWEKLPEPCRAPPGGGQCLCAKYGGASGRAGEGAQKTQGEDGTRLLGCVPHSLLSTVILLGKAGNWWIPLCP